MNFITAKKPGTFNYYGHSYDLEPITPPQVNLKDILAISFPLDLKICRDNPDTIQSITFDVGKLPNYPRLLEGPPQQLPKGSRLMLLRGGGIGDVIMLTPALRYLRKVVGENISISVSTFADRIPIIEGLGCIDTFFPHPIRLFDLIKGADYYMDFSDPKKIFNDADMIDFHLDSLYLDPASIPAEEKQPEISDGLRHSERVINELEKQEFSGRIKVLFSAQASHSIRHLPPSILELLSKKYPDVVFMIPSGHTQQAKQAGNIFHLDTSGGLQDFVTAIDRCDAIVSSDSSAYHIAAAVNTPGLVFFGPIGSKVRINYYPKVVALDSTYSGQTCHAPCGISALQETPPTIGIGATGIKNLEDGVKITTFTGQTFTFDSMKGCPESNITGNPYSPCMCSFSPKEILDGFEKTLSLIGTHKED